MTRKNNMTLKEELARIEKRIDELDDILDKKINSNKIIWFNR